VPKSCLKLEDVFRPLVYQPLHAKLLGKFPASTKAFKAEKITSNLDRICPVADLAVHEAFQSIAVEDTQISPGEGNLQG
jgi:hypothetical protein